MKFRRQSFNRETMLDKTTNFDEDHISVGCLCINRMKIDLTERKWWLFVIFSFWINYKTWIFFYEHLKVIKRQKMLIKSCQISYVRKFDVQTVHFHLFQI